MRIVDPEWPCPAWSVSRPGSVRRASAVAAVLVVVGLAAPHAAAQGTIRGTVHAPPGQDIRGAVVVACYVEGGRCNYASPHPNSRAFGVTARGASATFLIRDLAPGEYEVLGTRDVNGNGAEDAGDWIAQHGPVGSPSRVRPPAEGIELRFAVKTAATVAAPPTASRPATPGTPASSPSVPPAPGRGGLSGIYHGVTRNVVAPGAGSSVASGITWTPGRDWMTFFPDGRVFLALPPTGVSHGFDWAVQCTRHETWCATYTVEGERVTIRWRTGETRVLTRRDGMLWTQDRLNYLHLPSLDGLRLEGRFGVPWKDYVPARIAFTRDGQFVEEGLLDGVSWDGSDYSDAARAIRAVPRGAGTYEIRNNTLSLRYRDGRVVHVNMYIFPEELAKRQPEEIYINGFDLKRMP
jgi:uncharacterized protein (DUF2141 family)